jgi:hypothetical protein
MIGRIALQPPRLSPGVIALALVALLIASAARASSAQERLAKDYLQTAVKGDAEEMLGFYHPGEIADLRARVLKALEEEGTSDKIRTQMFGVATSMDEVRRLTPTNLCFTLLRRVGVPAERVADIKVLGVVEENSQLAHVLARLIPPKDSLAHARLAVVSLIRYGKDWRVALPDWFQSRVDSLLAGKEDTLSGAAPTTATGANTSVNNPAGTSADAPAHTPANSSAIVVLLDSGSATLRQGDCAAYFNEVMSPNFRNSTSAKALKTLIAQCERNVDTRETYIQALEIAKRLTPTYEQSGARAIYDMKGQGLPFERFVLEKVGARWFVAE